MKVNNLNDQQLSNYFSEHVRYEMQMLLNAVFAIKFQLKVPNEVEHMPVESFAIHLRNMITFFYPTNPRPNDVLAMNFFLGEETWSRIRPKVSSELEIAKRRADTEVGHLTTFRQNGTPKSKEWDVLLLVNELMPVAEIFVNSADKVSLSQLFEPIKNQHATIMTKV